MTFVVIERMPFSRLISVNWDCESTWTYVKETRPEGLLNTPDREKGVILSPGLHEEAGIRLCDDSGPHWLVFWLPGVYAKGWVHKLRIPLSPRVFSVACSWLLKWPTPMLFIHSPVCPSAPAVILSESHAIWHQLYPFATAAEVNFEALLWKR